MVSLTSTRLFRLAGWSAYVGAVASFVALASIALQYTRYISLSWTVWNLSRIIIPISMLPIAAVLDRRHREDAPTVSWSAKVIGVAGMLALAGVWTVQAFRPSSFDVHWPELQVEAAAGVAIGFWFLFVSYLVSLRGRWPTDLAWLPVIAGTGFIVQMVMTYSLWATPRDPTNGAAFITGFFGFMGTMAWLIAYPVWAIWLGRTLSAES